MCIYPNLDKESKARGINKKTLAEMVNIRYQTFIVKCNGKNYFTFDEALAIKRALGTSLTLEQLFEKAVNVA